VATSSRHEVTQHQRGDVGQSEVTVLWTASEVRCVVVRYDEIRYQLRLLRGLGTIKSDVLGDYARALVVSREWHREFFGAEPPVAQPGDV
jgi:hypothetical protein